LAALLAVLAPREAAAAPPRDSGKAADGVLRQLDEPARGRLRDVAALEVTPRGVRKYPFAFELNAMCTKYLGWSRGTAMDFAALRAMLAQRSIADRVAAVGDDPVAVAKLARELSDMFAGMRSACEQVLAGTPSPAALALLRADYSRELGDSLAQLLQVHDKARVELTRLLDKIAPYTSEQQLIANVDAFGDLASTFIDRADAELAGERASAFSLGTLGAAARTAFDGLADFLLDRAQQEAIAFLREQLLARVCAPDADPILFIPKTCELLEQADPDMSLSAMGTALRSALLEDLEQLPDRALVLGSQIEPQLGYLAANLRVEISLVRAARARTSPLEFTLGLYSAPALDCERLAPPGHASGDQTCADAMAVLRLTSLIIDAVATHTSTSNRSPARAYLDLACAFALEQGFAQMPVEAQARILAALGWSSFEFDAARIAALGDVLVDAERSVPELEKVILTLMDQVADGERAIADEDMYRIAQTTTVLLAGVGAQALKLFPTLPGADTLTANVAQLPRAFELAQAWASEDWGDAVVGLFEHIEAQLEQHGEPADIERFTSMMLAIHRYMPLMLEIANAQSSEQVNNALQAAFPVGGYKRKFRERALSINAFLGLYGGATLASSLPADNQPAFGRLGGEFSLFAPVGMQLTGPVARHRPRSSHVGLLLAVVDLGAITTAKWLRRESNPPTADDSQTALAEPATFNLAGLVTPGAYFTVGIADSPFTFGLGGSVSPFAQKLTTTTRDSAGDIESVDARYLPAVRIGAFLAVDITFISFGLR
jgi:hypothetical protein